MRVRSATPRSRRRPRRKLETLLGFGLLWSSGAGRRRPRAPAREVARALGRARRRRRSDVRGPERRRGDALVVAQRVEADVVARRPSHELVEPSKLDKRFKTPEDHRLLEELDPGRLDERVVDVVRHGADVGRQEAPRDTPDLASKETIEIMNLTNEIWHQFRNFLPFSAFFGHFL